MTIYDNVNLISAIGTSGQIGLDGKLPWHDSYDLKRFKDLTMGDVLIIGSNTAKELPKLPGRTIHVFDRTQDPEMIIKHYVNVHNRIVWIAGGAKVYEIFSPFVRNYYITRINYDGPADTYFPTGIL